MAKMIGAKMDLSEVLSGLDKLSGPLAESLARRMAVAGGRVIRDEAALRAPVSDGEYNPNSRGSQKSGTLRDSIYVAYNTTKSNTTRHVYSVSWNKHEAWWGWLVEFGYTRPYGWAFVNGVWVTNKSRVLPQPVRIPAQPFLGPAYDAKLPEAHTAMLKAGRYNLPILLAGGS